MSRFVGGALADDPARRRVTAVGGYASTAVATGMIGACTQVWQVGVLRAAGWLARGLRVPARKALLADVVAPSAYGRMHGFERAMDNLGAVGGPLLALPLIGAVSVGTAVLLSIIPGLLAVAATVYAIRGRASNPGGRVARLPPEQAGGALAGHDVTSQERQAGCRVNELEGSRRSPPTAPRSALAGRSGGRLGAHRA